MKTELNIPSVFAMQVLKTEFDPQILHEAPTACNPSTREAEMEILEAQ